MQIVKQVLYRLRAFYLITGLAGGMLGPYVSLLFSNDGLPSYEIGIVTSVGTLVAIVVQPVWGLVVDRYRITRITLALTFAVPAVVTVLYNVRLLPIILFAYMASTVFSSPQAPIADAFAVSTARRAQTQYGTIRSFGSLGYAVGGFAGGQYVAHLSPESLWVPYAILCMIGVGIALWLPKAEEVPHARKPLSAGMTRLLKKPEFLLFLLGGFLVSETLTAFNTYFVLAFRSIGGSLALTGVAFLIASITNVPAMLFAARVIRKIGRERTMMIAAFAYIVRWGIQAFVPIPAVALGVQLLHGTSFGFFYVAAVDYVAEVTGPEMQATGQSLFSIVCGGMAVIVGNLVNGYLFHYGGATVMYEVCALCSVAATICFWVVVRRGRLRVAESE